MIQTNCFTGLSSIDIHYDTKLILSPYNIIQSTVVLPAVARFKPSNIRPIVIVRLTVLPPFFQKTSNLSGEQKKRFRLIASQAYQA